MFNLAKLFGKSPFAALQLHMQKVEACMGKLEELLGYEDRGEVHLKGCLLEELAQLELDADQVKNDILLSVPKTFLLPVNREYFFRILTGQDLIADKALDIGQLVGLQAKITPDFFAQFRRCFLQELDLFFQVQQATAAEIDDLLESSFGGDEARKVRTAIELVLQKRKIQKSARYRLLQELIAQGNSLGSADFWLHSRLLEALEELSHATAKLAFRFCFILHVR